MALTEDEKRSLQEIEDGLHLDGLRTGSPAPGPPARRRIGAGTVGLVAAELLAGIAVVLLGLILHSGFGVDPGVVGYLGIVAAGYSATRPGRPSPRSHSTHPST